MTDIDLADRVRAAEAGAEKIIFQKSFQVCKSEFKQLQNL